MPLLNGPSCATGNNCGTVLFPPTVTSCFRSLRKAGVNDLYFIPCSETLSLANITSLTWWNGLKTDGKLGNIGVGLGSIGKDSTTTEQVGSETGQELTGIKWALTYKVKNYDNTSVDTTWDQMDKLIRRFPSFLAIARMSWGEDVILPIGVFTTADFDWVNGEDSATNQYNQFKLVWEEFGFPKQYTVAGLSAVIPKAR